MTAATLHAGSRGLAIADSKKRRSLHQFEEALDLHVRICGFQQMALFTVYLGSCTLNYYWDYQVTGTSTSTGMFYI